MKTFRSLLYAPTLLLISASFAFAEETEKEAGRWYPTLESGLTMTQSSYSSNWKGGDRGSIVWTFNTNATLENQINDKTNWSNALKLAFGQTHQQSADSNGDLVWDRPEKSTDLFDIESVLRFTLGQIADPYLSAGFETQFLDVSDTGGRRIGFNPLKFHESVGIAKKMIEENERELTSRLGVAFHQSCRKFFSNPAPAMETESRSTNDGGVEWVTDYKSKILDDQVSWTSKLTFYRPVYYSDKSVFDDLTAGQLEAHNLPTDVADYTTAPEVDWENIFTAQITKYLSVNFYVQWIYDKYDNTVPPVLNETVDGLANPDEVLAAIRKAGQYKQTLSLGVTYRFL